jgi:hypothetical protein
MTRRAWTVLTVLGVLLAVAAPVGWVLTRPPRTVGASTAEQLAGPTPGAPAAGARPAAAGGRRGQAAGGAGSGSAVPVRDGRPGDGRVGAAPAPYRLELPTLGVRAAIRPVGVDGTGQLEIPDDVAAVGWYRFGPRPGDPGGSTVLSGHVDSAEQGRGAFFRLRELDPGDPVVVRDGAGLTRRYRVVAREEWPKREVPLERIFSRLGAPRLTLVTCGGGFREDVRSYRDTIAVTAVPDGSP